VHLDDVNLTKDYDPNVGYGNSKTATIWMAKYIGRFYGPRGVHATAIHPGGIFTALFNCGVGGPAKDTMSILDPGYAPHAFDEEGENRLWELSSKLSGITVEI